MKQLFSILVACVLCTPAFASEWQCTRDGGVMFASNHVISLPQDQSKTYCSIFYDPRDAQQQQVVRWFDENPQLADLKQKTHFSAIPATSTMFAARYAGSVGHLPCIRLQSSNGETLCQMSGNRIPLSAEATASCIESTLRRRNVEPAQPDMHYHLHYQAEPEEKIKPNVQPDVFTKRDNSMTIPIWAFITVGVVATVAGVAVQWSQTYRN